MATIDQIHKELDLIQDVVKRMADNSFKVKAWMIGIAGGILAISKDAIFFDQKTDYSSGSAIAITLFLMFLIVSFWYLDAFFLYTEKLYRELYKWAVANRTKTNEYLYDLNTFKRKVGECEEDLAGKVESKFALMFSKTLLPFYLLPFLFIVVLFLLNLIDSFK